MSLKAAFLFLAGFLLTYPVLAQQFQPLVFKPHQKQWEDGSLKVSDFKGRTFLNAQARSELVYYLGFVPEKLKSRDTVVFRLKAYSYMDRDQSWMVPGADSANLLRYNQALFNLVEIYERKLQYNLNRISNIYQADQEATVIFNQLKTEAASLGYETGLGEDAAVVRTRLNQTTTELQSFPKEKLPPFQKRNFSYGMHAGLGYGVLSGTLAENFTDPLVVVYGFDCGYKRSVLLLNAALGGNEVKKQFTEEHTWPADQETGTAFIEASYGYVVLDGSKVKLTPFAGWSVLEISANARNESLKDHRLTDHTFSAGLVFDYKLRKRFLIMPNVFGAREATETTIRTRLSVSPVRYDAGLKGTLVQLSTEINLSGNLLKKF